MLEENNIEILTINPGSTSTKIAIFKGETCVFEKNIKHSVDQLSIFPNIISQLEHRKEMIFWVLEEAEVSIDEIKYVMGRGGLTYPLEAGIYKVDHRMMTHLRAGIMGEHASNLGPILAYEIARDVVGAEAYIANPVVVDELEPIARLAGHPDFERRSIFHALNQKAVARWHARSLDKEYEELNLIVAHLGGGISVGAHQHGRVIDVNNALDGEGPFSPERSGTLPSGGLIEACFTHGNDISGMKQKVKGLGGVCAYLGTNNMIEVEDAALNNGDEKSKFIIDGMNYQISKSIGEMATVLCGKVDGILITGGMAYSKYMVEEITKRTEFIAKVTAYPGEQELAALALNACLLDGGKLLAKKYPH